MDDCVMGLMPSCIHILCHVTAQFRPLKERWLFPHAFTFSSAIRLVLVTRIRKRKHGATFERRSQKALYASFFPICAFAVSSACPGQLGAPRRADRWHRWELCAYNVVQSYPMSRATPWAELLLANRQLANMSVSQSRSAEPLHQTQLRQLISSQSTDNWAIRNTCFNPLTVGFWHFVMKYFHRNN